MWRRGCDMLPEHNELARLASLSTHDLRIEWLRHFPGEPPRGLSRDLLLRAITCKVQERGLGGLSQAAKRTLRQVAEQMTKEGARGDLNLAPTFSPGVRLVRDWHGRAHGVLVLEDGFEYQGERYRSLAQIASRITGAHWSGPRFFGLAWAKIGSASVRPLRDNKLEVESHGSI